MYNEGDKYKGIINIVGGLHVLLVNLKFFFIGNMIYWVLRELWVKLKIIASSRETRLCKQTFEALVHIK